MFNEDRYCAPMIQQLNARLSAFPPRKRRRLESEILAVLHAAEDDDERAPTATNAWAPFSSISDRLLKQRVKKPNKSYVAACCNYVLVEINRYNAATTYKELLKLVLVIFIVRFAIIRCRNLQINSLLWQNRKSGDRCSLSQTYWRSGRVQRPWRRDCDDRDRRNAVCSR